MKRKNSKQPKDLNPTRTPDKNDPTRITKENDPNKNDPTRKFEPVPDPKIKTNRGNKGITG